MVSGWGGGGSRGRRGVRVNWAQVISGHGRREARVGGRLYILENIEIKIAISVHLPYSGSQSLRASLRQLIMSARQGSISTHLASCLRDLDRTAQMGSLHACIPIILFCIPPCHRRSRSDLILRISFLTPDMVIVPLPLSLLCSDSVSRNLRLPVTFNTPLPPPKLCMSYSCTSNCH